MLFKPLPFDAVIFDLDGVITKTAKVHSHSWKKMFDEYLLKREKENGEVFKEFFHETDYLPFVDGKLRYQGVVDFLASRNISVPYGDVCDSPETESICGLGNRKDQAFNEVLQNEGVEMYQSTVDFIYQLIENNIRIGVASSSKNCKKVLEKAGLLSLFETRVDGVISAEIGLKGKPEPDIFTTACDNLGVAYHKTIVIEDAISGVQAGKKGNFGLVLGIARENNKEELKKNGADIVVKDMSEISFDNIRQWFDKGLEDDGWTLTYENYDEIKERSREALLTIGNGYFGTRGSLEEFDANEINYPGTYMVGTYNRLQSKVGDRIIENEDFVCCPNWLKIKCSPSPKDFGKSKILELSRKLDFRTGLLSKKMIIKDNDWKKTLIKSYRVASMYNPHLAAIKYEVTPINYSGDLFFESSLNGDIINDGVKRYRDLNQQHLQAEKVKTNKNFSFIEISTTQSNIHIWEASLIKVKVNGKEKNIDFHNQEKKASVKTDFSFHLEEGQTATVEKLVSIHNSMIDGSGDYFSVSKKELNIANSFDEILKKSEESWKKIWKKADVVIEGDRLAQKLLRLHIYHLMISFSPHNKNYDASLTARGLHGEAYRGHIFWDELFIIPFYFLHFPEVAKATLMYRYRRLSEAKKYAKEYNFKGAMFPWQSGSSGREETQTIHLNPKSGKWGKDFSSLQRHVSLAIAYNTWMYFHTTNDVEFLKTYGAELFFEICRFWESKCEWNENLKGYEIKKVMGPDEFHEKYQGAKEGGIKDNAYTNIMVAWAFKTAKEIFELVGDNELINLDEIDKWQKISKKLKLIIKDGIIAQYDGYFELEELDWNHYREKYGNIYRMDRILKAEGKPPDAFKVAKQADTLMIFYNLNKDVVDDILQDMGYDLPKDYLEKNLKYYLSRTSHGSTLSSVVHSHFANLIDDKDLSYKMYNEALQSDFNDIQGGTTTEGIHAGVMAGTIMIALSSFAGVDYKTWPLEINPKLPKQWKKIKFNFQLKEICFFVEVDEGTVKIKQINQKHEEVDVFIGGRKINLQEGIENIVGYNNESSKKKVDFC